DVALRSIEVLLDRLRDPVAEIRAAAAEAFRRIAAGGGLSDAGLNAIARCVVHGASEEASRACGMILVTVAEVPLHGSRLAMVASGFLVRALLASEVQGSEAKHTVLSVLAQIVPSGFLPAETALHQVAVADKDASVRLAALDALRASTREGQGCSQKLREAALHLVLDDDEVVRDAAAELLADLPHAEASPDEPVLEEETRKKLSDSEDEGEVLSESESEEADSYGDGNLSQGDQVLSASSSDLPDLEEGPDEP
ncbi:unnamed protein product, partial [Polarella glacialis]